MRQIYAIIYYTVTFITEEGKEVVKRKRHMEEIHVTDADEISAISQYYGLEEFLKKKHECELVEIMSLTPLRKEEIK
jgi:hypothetical protein